MAIVSHIIFTEADDTFPFEGKFEIRVEFDYTLGEKRRVTTDPTRVDPPEGAEVQRWCVIGGHIGVHKPLMFERTDRRICDFIERAFEDTITNAIYDHID